MKYKGFYRSGHCTPGTRLCELCRDEGREGEETRAQLAADWSDFNGSCPKNVPMGFRMPLPQPRRRERGAVAEPEIPFEETDDATYAIRIRSCFGGDGAEPCPRLVRTEAGNFCGACKCAQFPRTRLDAGATPKLRWAKLDCPLRRPGFSNSDPSPG